MNNAEHVPTTVERSTIGFLLTCTCGETFEAQTVLGAWEKGAKHAGVELT